MTGGILTKHKLPIVVSVIVILAAVAGMLLNLPVAPVEPKPGGSASIGAVSPGVALGFPTHSPLSGIVAIHFMNSGSGYSDTENLNLRTQGDNDRIGSIVSSGGSITTFPYDTSFDIIIEVQGHDDNMGQVTEAYLVQSLAFYLDTGTFLTTENSSDATEYLISTDGTVINMNVKWDNSTSHYSLSADDNMHLENMTLWLRG